MSSRSSPWRGGDGKQVHEAPFSCRPPPPSSALGLRAEAAGHGGVAHPRGAAARRGNRRLGGVPQDLAPPPRPDRAQGLRAHSGNPGLRRGDRDLLGRAACGAGRADPIRQRALLPPPRHHDRHPERRGGGSGAAGGPRAARRPGALSLSVPANLHVSVGRGS